MSGTLFVRSLLSALLPGRQATSCHPVGSAEQSILDWLVSPGDSIQPRAVGGESTECLILVENTYSPRKCNCEGAFAMKDTLLMMAMIATVGVFGQSTASAPNRGVSGSYVMAPEGDVTIERPGLHQHSPLRLRS